MSTANKAELAVPSDPWRVAMVLENVPTVPMSLI